MSSFTEVEGYKAPQSYYDPRTEQAVTLFAQSEQKAIETGRVLVITNISKLPNIVQLGLLAAAHDFVSVIVGMPKIDSEDLIAKNIPFFRIRDIPNLNSWMNIHEIPLMGIEIMESAVSLHENPFTKRIALMPGNEGTGLSPAQKAICKNYVIIPQYGMATASLNVHVASCLVLYKYTQWCISS